MNKSLFAFGLALMAGTSAFAMDVTNPFYIPMKGDFLSDTTALYQNAGHGSAEGIIAVESLSYGLTDNFTLQGTVADNWYLDTIHVPNSGHDRFDNPSWNVGVKYNLVDDCTTNLKAQLVATYGQGSHLQSLENPVSAFVDHHLKTFVGQAKVGYQLDYGLLPYVTATIEKQVGKRIADPTYMARAALYESFNQNWSAEIGGTYRWTTETFNNGFRDLGHTRYWTLDSGVNYVFSDCMSVGVKGSYILDAKADNIDYYTVGMNFKVAF